MGHRPHAFTSVTLEVPDVAATARFLTYHVGLEEVTSGNGTRFLRCGLEHHCVQLREGSDLDTARVDAIAYSVNDRETFDVLIERAKDAGAALRDSDRARRRFATDVVSLQDPNGLTVELVLEPYLFAEPPITAFGPVEMVHPFLWTANYHESLSFYVDVLGFAVSDYIEDKLAFLRCGALWHHSLALLDQSSFAVAHLCFLMPSLEDVMRGRARAQYRNVDLPVDMVKHSASESIAVYLYDPRHGPWLELCDSHRRLSPDEDLTHVPRRMADDPRNVMDVWRASADHDWRMQGQV